MIDSYANSPTTGAPDVCTSAAGGDMDRSQPSSQLTSDQHSRLSDGDGQYYLDLSSGDGSLTYGSESVPLNDALLSQFQNDLLNRTRRLNYHSGTHFSQSFEDKILVPRHLNYDSSFEAENAATTLEKAIRIAQASTGRQCVVCFVGPEPVYQPSPQFRDGTTSALRAFWGSQLNDVNDYLETLDTVIEDPSNGFDAPAAFILEPIQINAGFYVSEIAWMEKIQRLAHKHGSLVILDETETAPGRLGTFFSFEGTNFRPDVVVLSKSLGGVGLSMSVLLWDPTLVHFNAICRQNFASIHPIVTTTALTTLDWWTDDSISEKFSDRTKTLKSGIASMCAAFPNLAKQGYGAGLLQGIQCSNSSAALEIQKAANKLGIIIQRCGLLNDVLRMSPPITIDTSTLQYGLEKLSHAVGKNSSP